MKQILSDFIRRRTGMLIKCALIAMGFAAAAWIPLMFSGGWADWFRVVWTIGAVVVSAAVASLLVKAFVDIFGVARCRLEEQLSNMPEAEREGVISAYPSAKVLGERWFMPEHILFYTARRALLLRYDAIKNDNPEKRRRPAAGDFLRRHNHAGKTQGKRRGAVCGASQQESGDKARNR